MASQYLHVAFWSFPANIEKLGLPTCAAAGLWHGNAGIIVGANKQDRYQQEQGLSAKAQIPRSWSRAAQAGTPAVAPHWDTLRVMHTLGQMVARNLNFQQNSGKQLQLLSEHFWKRNVMAFHIVFPLLAHAQQYTALFPIKRNLVEVAD